MASGEVIFQSASPARGLAAALVYDTVEKGGGLQLLGGELSDEWAKLPAVRMGFNAEWE